MHPTPISPTTIKATLGKWTENAFYNLLCEIAPQGKEKANTLCSRYGLGRAKNEGVIFWHTDKQGVATLGKLAYLDATGKIIAQKYIDSEGAKDSPTIGVNSVLFGANLLTPTTKEVYLLQSPENALLLTFLFPFVCLATGECHDHEALKVLQGRHVCIVPNNDNIGELWAKEVCKSLEALQIDCEVWNIIAENANELPHAPHALTNVCEFLCEYARQTFAPPKEATTTTTTAKNEYSPTTTTPQTKGQTIPFAQYVANLECSNFGGRAILLHNGYPASWDLNAPYLTAQTNSFLWSCLANPSFFEMHKLFDLHPTTNAPPF